MSSVIAFFRKPQSWPIVLIPVGLLVWAGFAAPVLVRDSFYSLVYFDGPYQAALPVRRAGEAIAEQVVIVVLDGLRVDASQRMPTLNHMRALGADRVALVGLPSLLIGARLEAMFALMAAMVVVGILGRKSSANEIMCDAANTLFVVAMALAVQLLIFYVTWGVVFTKYLPDLNWGFKFFLDMLQTMAFWPTTSLPLAILLPYIALLTVGVAKLATSVEKLYRGSISAR